MRLRVLLAINIGIVSAALCLACRVYVGKTAGDFFWPFCAADALVSGIDPYGPACLIQLGETIYPPNPLTTALVALPFLPFGKLAPSLLWGIGSGLLAFGLFKDGQWWRLLVFTSTPYWAALRWVQWSPTIAAVMLLPALLPLTLVKPHIGFPVAVLRLTWRRAAACALFLGVSLAVDPTWPLRWWPQTRSYTGVIPLLLLPFGPLLLLALLRWRDERARLLLLMAVIPQRHVYDLTVLWLIPQTARQMLLLSGSSWLAAGLWWIGLRHTWMLTMAFIYVPVLILVLRFSSRGDEPARYLLRLRSAADHFARQRPT